MALGTESRFGPDPRARALERFGSEKFDVLVVGGGVTGCGAALDAASRGLVGGAGGKARLRRWHLQPLQQADPRRAALSRELRHRARARGPARAPPTRREDRPPPGAPDTLPLPAQASAVWDRFYMGSGLFLYDALAGLHPAMPHHRHLTPSLVPAGGPGAAFRLIDRRYPLLRRPGRRRPLLTRAGADRRCSRGGLRLGGRGRGLCPRRRPGCRGPGCRTSSREASSRCVRAR